MVSAAPVWQSVNRKIIPVTSFEVSGYDTLWATGMILSVLHQNGSYSHNSLGRLWLLTGFDYPQVTVEHLHVCLLQVHVQLEIVVLTS